MNPYLLEFKLYGLPRTLNSRGHWRVTHLSNQKWYGYVALAVGANRPPKPLERASLVLTRHSSVAMDHDNLVSGFKAIVDGLKHAGVIVDDKWENIGMPEYRWRKCKPGEGHVEVSVRGSDAGI